MRFSPMVAPFAIFLLLFLLAALRALRFLWKVRATVSDGQLGKAVHLETPLGAIDVRPQQGPDSDLANIPKYPGAVPVRELISPAYEVDIHAPGRAGRYVSEAFRTDDQAEMVLDFYRRELPDWQEDRLYQHGFRLIHENVGSQCAITIRRQNGRTAIEHAAVHPEKDVSSAGTTFASDSNFGVLR